MEEFHLLVIDDDRIIGRFISFAAEYLNINCTITTTPQDFLAALKCKINIILIDLVMPEMDGIELLRILAEQKCRTGIILMSSLESRVLESASNFASAKGLYVIGHLIKPFRIDELAKLIRKEEVLLKPRKRRPRVKIVEKEIIQAIQEKQFVLHYQPKIEVTSKRFIGVEALVRWQHPRHGLIYPDAFISQLESNALIDELHWIVIERGLREIDEISPHIKNTLTLSFNLSPYSLHDCNYPDKLIAKINQFDIKPENIILEITESGLFGELSNVLDILTRLRIKQIQLSIDDFGTGYATMEQLKNIPATEIKIEKSFVQNMLIQDSVRVIVQKIIEIGKELGMKVVGEGVENPEQLQFLKENSCDIAQGFFIAKPLARNDLIDWINN